MTTLSNDNVLQKYLGIVFAAAVGVALLSPAFCFGQEMPSSLSGPPGWTRTRESRQAQATEWRAEISKIEKQIPTLSPAEEKWLKTEYDDEIPRDGHITARAGRAMASREYRSRSTKPIAQNMVLILTALSAASPLREDSEVILWTRLAYVAIDLNFWGDIAGLGELGVLERSPKVVKDFDYQQWLYNTWAFRADEILGQIILPYLNKAPRK